MPNETFRAVIVEYDNVTRFLMKRALAKSKLLAEIQIIDFSQPMDALAMMSDIDADVNVKIFLIIEIHMAGMEASEFLEKFEELAEDKKRMYEIIVISSTLREVDIELVRAHPCVSHYLDKTMITEDLPLLIK